MNYDREIDTSGTFCPIPILRAKKELASMESKQILKVIATDPGSIKDFEAYCRQTGDTLAITKELESHIFYIHKS